MPGAPALRRGLARLPSDWRSAENTRRDVRGVLRADGMLEAPEPRTPPPRQPSRIESLGAAPRRDRTAAWDHKRGGMKTVVEWFREQEGWRREHCYACCGTGMTSDYGCGEDFYGPKECTTCNGNGMYGSRRRAGTWSGLAGGLSEVKSWTSTASAAATSARRIADEFAAFMRERGRR
jgi:hypothetical protein